MGEGDDDGGGLGGGKRCGCCDEGSGGESRGESGGESGGESDGKSDGKSGGGEAGGLVSIQPCTSISATASVRAPPGKTSVTTDAPTPPHPTENERPCADSTTVTTPHRVPFSGEGRPIASLTHTSKTDSSVAQHDFGPCTTTSAIRAPLRTDTDSHGSRTSTSDMQRFWRPGSLPISLPSMQLAAANAPSSDG